MKRIISLLLTLSMLLSFCAGLATLAETTGWTKEDDSAASVQYSEGWSAFSPPETSYGGSVHYAVMTGVTAGAEPSVTYSFNGTKARFYGCRRYHSTSLRVYVDNVLQETIETYKPELPDAYDQMLYETKELADGPHTLKIEGVAGEHPVDPAAPIYLIVDGFAYRAGGSAEPDTWTKVNQGDESVAYSLGWSTYGMNGAYQEDIGAIAISGLQPGNEPYVEYTFTGTGARFYGAKRPDSYQCKVYIDGSEMETIDTRADSELYDQMLYETPELSYGTHVLKVEAVLDENTVGAGGTLYFVTDAFAFTAKETPDKPTDPDYIPQEEPDYMNLQNFKGQTGVPLGGIGTGSFMISPEGKFSKINLNNTDAYGNINYPKGSFLAVYEKDADGQSARRLERDQNPSNTSFGMKGFTDVTYRGLMPFIDMHYQDANAPADDAKITMEAFSGLTPNNSKDSALPVSWIEVTVENPSDQPKEVGVAFSWEDVLGKNIMDLTADYDAFENVAWDKGLRSNDGLVGGGKMEFAYMQKPNTFAQPVRIGGMQGVMQSCDPMSPRKYTYQNYNNRVAVLGQADEGVTVTTLPSYNTSDSTALKSFTENGSFAAAGTEKTALSTSSKTGASAVALKKTLAPGEQYTYKLMLSWHMPENDIDYQNDNPKRYFGKADFNRYYHNWFQDIESLIAYAADNKQRIYDESKKWQQPILDSTYEDWMKFKILNSQVPIYYNSIFNKAGDFALQEGGMVGPLGTMDVRALAYEYYSKFNAALDRSEMNLFTKTQKENGVVLHFDGDYYVGIADETGATPTPENAYLDNTGGWLTQVAKDYKSTGDFQYIKDREENIKKAIRVIRTYIKGDLQIPFGPIMFDDCWVPEACSYLATQYLSWLNAGKSLAEALGDQELADECAEQFEKTYEDTLKYLWVKNEHGSYLVYGAKNDGTGRLDNTMYTNQLAGQFMSRAHMNGDVLPMELVKASVVSQMKAQIWANRENNFLGPRIWDLDKGEAFMYKSGNPNDWQDNYPSTCWAFYLDCFMAMPALQAGYVEDAFTILKNTQLAYMNNGNVWAQNLWDRGNISRMDVAMSWWLTDLMAGSGLDLPNKTLYLAPVIRPQDEGKVVRYPVYFSDFWGNVEIDTENKTVKFTVTEKATDQEISLETIRVQPVGVSTDETKDIMLDAAFAVKQGAVLDLTSSYDILTSSVQSDPVLKNASKVDAPQVDAPVFPDRPAIRVGAYADKNQVQVELSCTEGTEIYYTLDGTDPKDGGSLYTQALTVDVTDTLKVRSKKNDQWGSINIRRFGESFGINVGGTANGWVLTDGLEPDVPYKEGFFGGDTNGKPWSTTEAIQNDFGMPAAMQTQNFCDDPMTYRFDVPNGFYTVTLYFAELFYEETGKRTFDVKLKDQLVLENLDVFKEAGGKNIGYARKFVNVEVTDGKIDLQFIKKGDTAIINVIQIAKQDGQIISPTGVELDHTTLTLQVGKTGKLTAKVLPENATDPSVQWSSSQPAIVSVDSEGNLTAESAGTAVITVTTLDGGKTASCTVTVPTDKTALKETLDEAAKKQENDYTPSSWRAFSEKKTAADAVFNDQDATQKMVDDANKALKEVMAKLTARADTTRLQAVLAQAEKKVEEDFTPASWKPFADAVLAAKAMIENLDATQSQIDEMKAELEQQMTQLAERAETSALQEAIDQAAAKKESAYTYASWKTFAEALSAARAVCSDLNTSQEKVDGALRTLREAMSALTRKEQQQKNGWHKENGGWYFYQKNIKKTGWILDRDNWYFLGTTGKMQTGWYQADGKWYFSENSGAMVTGWKKLGKWYYFGTDGAMKTGWYQVNGKWYFSESSGAMVTGWKKLGKWYYFGTDGAMKTGWYKVNGKWYFSENSGAMVTGWKKLGKWYYFGTDGAMKTGWQRVGGKWYYLESSGKMVYSTARIIQHKEYIFNSNGQCVNP